MFSLFCSVLFRRALKISPRRQQRALRQNPNLKLINQIARFVKTNACHIINQSNAKETSARKFLAEPTMLCHNTQRQRYSQCNFFLIIYHKFNIRSPTSICDVMVRNAIKHFAYSLNIYSYDLTTSTHSHRVRIT